MRTRRSRHQHHVRALALPRGHEAGVEEHLARERLGPCHAQPAADDPHHRHARALGRLQPYARPRGRAVPALQEGLGVVGSAECLAEQAQVELPVGRDASLAEHGGSDLAQALVEAAVHGLVAEDHVRIDHLHAQQVGAQERAAHLHAVAVQVIRRPAARQQRGHGPVPQRQDRVEGAVAQRQRTLGLAGNLALATGVRDLQRLGGLALLVEAAAAARRHEGGHGEECSDPSGHRPYS